MKKEITLPDSFNHVYNDINDLIRQKKIEVKNAVNDAMISLYWGIGKKLTEEITGVNKPEYGKKVVLEISNRLSVDYGEGFNRSAISRMINFYQEFPDYEKVATLSQQLTWSHFIEILPITLFLTLPISWSGRVKQYAGRLHREYHEKKEVRIYDYLDTKIDLAMKMYKKRSRGYRSMGYEIIEDAGNDENDERL